MKKNPIMLSPILLFVLLMSSLVSKAHAASIGASIPATYAEAPLSSCPITTAEYVIVDAYRPSDFDEEYLDTFQLFTENTLFPPHYSMVDSISFYHIDSSNRQAAQACFGVALTNDTTTLAFKNGHLIAQISSVNISAKQLYRFLRSDPVSLIID